MDTIGHVQWVMEGMGMEVVTIAAVLKKSSLDKWRNVVCIIII
jgi:hypothetical protein